MIQYMNNLYKKHPSEYPDWEKHNPSCGHVLYGRFVTRILTCKNERCSRYNLDISEKEAFYLFMQLGFWSKGFPVMLRSNIRSLYVCPFCESRSTLHPKNNDLTVVKFFREDNPEDANDAF